LGGRRRKEKLSEIRYHLKRERPLPKFFDAKGSVGNQKDQARRTPKIKKSKPARLVRKRKADGKHRPMEYL